MILLHLVCNEINFVTVRELIKSVQSKQNRRLKLKDRVLQINGESVDGKILADILKLVKDTEEEKGTLELVVSRQRPTIPSPPKFARPSLSLPDLQV